ncbi:class I ribonucleotide reductase maintenance protein YfaE [Facilibium subflavum]|uniref:class I ribonucleotide reductase maintenance protein YfaE n=1 Tax=Facilibium subflavum TaxID=2219058 RepID=UPI000E64D8DC|nr:class I ribonucleotide reductase maintenance protein YfaE [Facilibium subflavum]
MKKIIFNSQTIDVQDEGKTILEALESAGVIVNYQCRDGICGTCRCQLIEGEVLYQQEPFAMAKNGEIFICVAKAKSDLLLKQ